MNRADGLRGLITSATPVMVPPVPTPATKKSTFPSVSRQTSSAVVARWIAGFAGFSNCCGMKYRESVFAISSARAIAPGMPSGPGVSTSSAPYARSSIRRSTLIVSGIVSAHRYPRAAHTMASAMPVLPLVGSRMMVSGLISPAFSAASIMATPIRSLTLPAGLKDSSLAATSATAPAVTRRNRTRGVFPVSSVMSLAMPMFLLLICSAETCPMRMRHYPPRHGYGSEVPRDQDQRAALLERDVRCSPDEPVGKPDANRRECLHAARDDHHPVGAERPRRDRGR